MKRALSLSWVLGGIAVLTTATACNHEDQSALRCHYTAAMRYGLRVDGMFQGAFTDIEAPTGPNGSLVLKNGLLPNPQPMTSWVTQLKKAEVLDLASGRVIAVRSTYDASIGYGVVGAKSEDDERCMVVSTITILVGDDARQQAQAMGTQMDAGMDGGVDAGTGQRR